MRFFMQTIICAAFTANVEAGTLEDVRKRDWLSCGVSQFLSRILNH